MIKLLKIKASRYKHCEDGIDISFILLSRKSEEDRTYELNEIDQGLYSFSTTTIIGKNASGKTSILNLFKDVYKILGTFQIRNKPISISDTIIEVTLYYLVV